MLKKVALSLMISGLISNAAFAFDVKEAVGGAVDAAKDTATEAVDSAKAAVTGAEEKPAMTEEAFTELATKATCFACHDAKIKKVGPSYNAVAVKYKDDDTALVTLSAKAKKGGAGVWGMAPMPPNMIASEEEITALVTYILALNPEGDDLKAAQDEIAAATAK